MCALGCGVSGHVLDCQVRFTYQNLMFVNANLSIMSLWFGFYASALLLIC
jgi:hypothetical protein